MTEDQLTDLATLHLAGKEDGDTLDLLPLLRAVVAAERERCASLCRRVGDETRNSADARAAGQMLANWISTGNPNDAGDDRPAPALLDVPHECMHAENGVLGA